MSIYSLTISPQGQITIPIDLRRQLNLKPGTDLVLSLVDWVKSKALVLRAKPKNPSAHGLGLGREIWEKVDADKYVKAERQAWSKKYE